MRTIALVDWNWMGHHPMYFRKLLHAFHELGCDVLPVCPLHAVGEIESWTSKQIGNPKTFTPIVARAPRKRQRLVPAFLRDREQAISAFGRLGRQLRVWEKKHGERIDLVFFPTIYDANFARFASVDRMFRYPWSGIYLHARAFRLPGSPLPYSDQLPCPEQIFTSRYMSSVCLLDEGVLGDMQQLAPAKPVIEFPDITETSQHQDGDSLMTKVRQLAGGRKIVTCLGALQKTKGLLELCHAIKSPELSDIFFFFGGEPYWGGTSKQEQAFIRSVWEESPNVITHLQRIVDERVMNDIISISDVIYAAYTNFPNSSNMMTKAAYYHKPMVVSDGFLMAERVRRYQLGRVIPEGSVEHLVQEIRHLCDQGGAENADYKGYYARHSDEALMTALGKVIAAIPKS